MLASPPRAPRTPPPPRQQHTRRIHYSTYVFAFGLDLFLSLSLSLSLSLFLCVSCAQSAHPEYRLLANGAWRGCGRLWVVWVLCAEGVGTLDILDIGHRSVWSGILFESFPTSVVESAWRTRREVVSSGVRCVCVAGVVDGVVGVVCVCACSASGPPGLV